MNLIKKRKLLTVLLMTVSQFLLAGFVLYWLFGQYKEEEFKLKKDLTAQFSKSQDQVLDSLLLIHIINPALNDSVKISLDYESKSFERSSGDTNEIRTIDVFDYKDTDKKKIIALELKEDSCIKEKRFDSIVLEGNQEEILTRSIKLIVSGTKKMFSSDSMKQMQLPAPLDTALLKKVFSDELDSKGLSFDLNWISEENYDSSYLKMAGIFLETDFPDELPGVNIRRYRPYLLGLMIPQFLFAFLLLGLSGFAFYFTYKNLKKQIKLNSIRTDFVNNITHELKTPVSTIMVATEALKNYDLKEDPKILEDYLKMMKDEALRLDGLISKVMDHTKLENKAGLILKERTDLNALVNEAIDKLKLHISENNIKIDFYPIRVSVCADIDPVYILGVICNLIDNSIKYRSIESDRVSEIKIRTDEDKQHVYMTVADNGPGIPEEYLRNVFDTFFRVPKGDKHNVKGYGLGLSYAKLVMTEHEGSISVENNSEGGCVFTLKFPKSKL